MEAVVLAGGKGTRLRPYTAELPKPLVPLGNRPILEYLLLCLKKHGVTRVHLAVNHLAHLIMAAIGDGSRLGLTVEYSHEDSPLSTIGPLTLLKNLPDHFVVVNGDVLTDLNMHLLYEHHLASGALVTVASHRRTERLDYGVLEIASDGVVTGFTEKPAYTMSVSMGVYVLAREALQFVPRGQRFGFDDLMRVLLERKQPIAAYPYDGFWLDIGRPDDYEQALNQLERLERLIK